jgi:hypothetical protein
MFLDDLFNNNMPIGQRVSSLIKFMKKSVITLAEQLSNYCCSQVKTKAFFLKTHLKPLQHPEKNPSLPQPADRSSSELLVQHHSNLAHGHV